MATVPLRRATGGAASPASRRNRPGTRCSAGPGTAESRRSGQPCRGVSREGGTRRVHGRAGGFDGEDEVAAFLAPLREERDAMTGGEVVPQQGARAAHRSASCTPVRG